MLMLIGTYTRGTGSAGIYGFEAGDGFEHVEACAVNGDIDNPSWLVRHPRLDVIYAVNEVRDGDSGGGIAAFVCDASGHLEQIDQKSSMGGDPCHLSIDPEGKFLLASNYGNGSLAGYPLAADGRMQALTSFVQHGGRGIDPMRQKGPHVHSAVLDAGARNAYVSDLGLDQVVRYPLASDGTVQAGARVTTRLKPGAGPRLMCFDSTCRFAYVINELDNTIVSFERDESGDLIELAALSALPDDFADASYCAHIALSGDDRFLYASNRGHDSIAVFRVEEAGGLAPVQYQPSLGGHPRHFALAPDGCHLLVANRDGNNVVVMARDPVSGALTPTGAEIQVPAPVCVLFLSPV